MADEWRTIPLIYAVCETCDKAWGGRNAHAVGAKHARHHKHKVGIDVTITYVYDHVEGSK